MSSHAESEKSSVAATIARIKTARLLRKGHIPTKGAPDIRTFAAPAA